MGLWGSLTAAVMEDQEEEEKDIEDEEYQDEIEVSF